MDKTTPEPSLLKLRSPSLFSYERCSSPLINCVASPLCPFSGLAPMALDTSHRGELRAGHSTLDALHQCCVEGRDHLPYPAGNIPPNAARGADKPEIVLAAYG